MPEPTLCRPPDLKLTDGTGLALKGSLLFTLFIATHRLRRAAVRLYALIPSGTTPKLLNRIRHRYIGYGNADGVLPGAIMAMVARDRAGIHFSLLRTALEAGADASTSGRLSAGLRGLYHAEHNLYTRPFQDIETILGLALAWRVDLVGITCAHPPTRCWREKHLAVPQA